VFLLVFSLDEFWFMAFAMTENSKITKQQAREKRRAEQLRANLQRRKTQLRARRAGEADETDGLPASNSSSEKNCNQ